MAIGIAIHIGLNLVDPVHYGGWDGKLNACEFDAQDMEQIAAASGFTTTTLLTAEATREAVIATITNAGEKLAAEDILLISYSGHGGQVPDISGDEENDFKDETWCLYDGQLIDDELRRLWSKMASGLRILVFSDSCHSGSVTKTAVNFEMVYSQYQPKFMPDEILARTYLANKEFYDGLATGHIDKDEVSATVKLISGCQDNQYSYDGPFNGAFTSALKKVWGRGKFKGDYSQFHKEIQGILPAYQSPNHMTYGMVNRVFDKQTPFTIEKQEDSAAP